MALHAAYQLPLFPAEPTEKRCTGCGRFFPLGDFYRKRGTHDGLTSACKDCIKERVRAYQEAHREERRAYGTAHYEANRERLQEQGRAYYQEHLDECRARGRRSSATRWAKHKAEQAARAEAAGVPDGHKVCTACGDILPFESFYGKRTGKYGLTGRCKECIKGNVRSYQAQNREACIARCAAYYDANRESLQAAAREYERTHRDQRKAHYAANVEQERAAQRAYREANRERVRAWQRAYYAEHREEISATRRAWQRSWERARREKANADSRRWYHMHKHEGKHRVRHIRRRALEHAAEGSFTVDDIRALYAAQEGHCAYCAVALGAVFHVDHVLPLSRGGSNYAHNLALSCPWCNLSKGAKTAEEFRAYLNERAQ